MADDKRNLWVQLYGWFDMEKPLQRPPAVGAGHVFEEDQEEAMNGCRRLFNIRFAS